MILSSDAANRLTSVTNGPLTTQYQYNGDGDRTRRWLNGTETRYALDPVGLTNILAETTGSQTTRYLPGLAQVNGSDRQYFLPDRLGSVRLVMPSVAGAEPLLLRNYDPFGKLRAQSGLGSSTFGYTGEPLEPLGGLVHLRARYYQAGTGRFLTPDSIIPDPLRSHGWNKYIYAANNPVRFSDPSGHCIVQYSGEVRMGQAPYGTSGLCPHTGTPGVEAAYAATQMHNNPPPDGFTPQEKAIIMGTALVAPEAAPELIAWMILQKVMAEDMKNLPGVQVGVVMPCGGGTSFAGKSTNRFIAGGKIYDKYGQLFTEGTTDLGPTLDRIRTGGGYSHIRDATTFGNREGLLPKQPYGYYTEYVHPTPGMTGPGPQRIVTGREGEIYYTPDHYQSFIRVDR